MEDRLKFKAFIQRHDPEFVEFWDWKAGNLLKEKVEEKIDLLSPGEKHMLKFYLGVWTRDNEYNFDFIQAMRYLDDKHSSAIREWVNNPIWP
ncbi:hypothetical protein AB204_02175 [Xenorhabdus khoisanae]|uniref:Uncharacterized protein n=1 Tax=Xenorhabdus khoisanae TaxID=880157 RepID=A0A0J5FWT3_9GAMM|nr:hypothetical protein [Xenorhabdus khoisanae]KMJ46654.1 hypothetical protein AB204_02175 [Xenorhabdus khoisanae]